MNVENAYDGDCSAHSQDQAQQQQAQGIDPAMLASITQIFTQVVTANQATSMSAAVAALQAAKSKESQPEEDRWDTYLQEA